MDLEGYTRLALRRGESYGDILHNLTNRILEIKAISRDGARDLASAVLQEVTATSGITDDLITFTPSSITMGKFGVGSRGVGDFYIHQKIAEVIGSTRAVIDSSHLDDSGVVRANGKYIVLTVDGMHSRLSDFPFLAGFHAARAALRDIYVMGALPIALLSDVHLADDGDVAKIFDYTTGIAAISELTNVPLVTGSTLRIGGDMVIGDRMTGCVGAVGIANFLTARKEARARDVILMTEGAGGGTISATALYFGVSDVVRETLNIKFLRACEILYEDGLTAKMDAMTDITNGGIRGDAAEISKIAGVKLIFDEEKIRALVNPTVLSMLDKLDIDYLGVSLDALLIIAPQSIADDILKSLRRCDIATDVVGRVEKGSGVQLFKDGEYHDLTQKFRESAYTPIKKVVGELADIDISEMRVKIDEAAKNAARKRKKVIQLIRGVPDGTCHSSKTD